MHSKEKVTFDLFLSLVEHLIRGKRIEMSKKVTEILLYLCDCLAVLTEDRLLKFDDAKT